MAVWVPPGQVQIWEPAHLGGLGLWCLQGETAAKVTGGGGWQAVERPRSRPATVWTGGPGLRVEMSLLLEDRHVIATGPVRDKVRTLEKMAGIDREDPEPPQLKFQAGLPHHDYNRAPANSWVIETAPEWGEPVYDDRGRLMHWPVSIVLLQHASSKLERLRKTAPFRTQTMKKGEDLRGFSKRVLGDAKRWKDIQSLNRDNPKCPTSPSFNVGREIKLRIPPKEK
jgi:hypothetical protein